MVVDQVAIFSSSLRKQEFVFLSEAVGFEQSREIGSGALPIRDPRRAQASTPAEGGGVNESPTAAVSITDGC